MKRLSPIVVLCLVCCCCCFIAGHSQSVTRPLAGLLRDSLTLEPIPFVYVNILSKKESAVSDEKGQFTIPCSVGDSLIFTRLGYKSKIHIVLTLSAPLVISLKESAFLLKAVTVYGSFKPTGADEWKNALPSNNPFENPTLRPGGGMQTFGPGGTIAGPISYFSKAEKEKRKLKKVKNEHAKTQVYRNTIDSPEVKEHLKKLFSLSDEEYNKKIEQFNREFPDAAYTKSEQELMEILIYFFARKN